MPPRLTHAAMSICSHARLMGAAFALGLATAGAPQSVAAQSAKPVPMTPADLFALEYAADPQISPDGQWVAYVRQWSDITTDRRYSNIWLVRANGTEHHALTTGKFVETAPRWSPDGSRLVFVSNRGGSAQLWRRSRDADDAAAITSGPTAPSAPTWSPDGAQIAYLALVPSAPLVIGTPLTPPPGATWAAPPKYDDRLVFRFNDVGELPRGFVHAFTVPASGGASRQVTSGDYQHTTGFGGGGTVAWTTDGAELIVAARRGERPEFNAKESDLWAFPVRGGTPRRLTTRVGPDQSPAVSPDGRWIAYTGYDDRHQGYQNTQLYVMARDGSGARVVSGAFDNSVSNPQWAADSKSLYVQSDERGNTHVLRFAVTGTANASPERIAVNLGSGSSAYSGGSYSVARTGAVAYSHSTPSIPSQVARVETAGSTPAVLTTLNATLLAQRTLGAVQEITYPSSKDGRSIQGWVITPPGFDPNKKYPFILEIHGGPFMNYGDRFDEEKQLMAAQGFVVLYLNPRGSTSYGETFGNLIHHAYPGDDFYDLNAGVDAVIAKGFVDPSQLYVTGGSGGGVLTAWMISHTDRFRAALAFYPVINWESFALTADMAPTAVNDWFPGFPWDHRDNYDQRSLLNVVDKVKTPTLIMTGEEDFRTPMSESEQYYKALKMRGVDAVLVRVPDEPHGIRRRPSHEASKITTLMGWIARYRGTGM